MQTQTSIQHPLHLHHPLLRSFEDNGWGCDGRNRNGGCRSGITGFGQTKGMIRWSCKICNYDLCDNCARDISSSSGHNTSGPKAAVTHELHNHPMGLYDSRRGPWSCDGNKRPGGCRSPFDVTDTPRYRCVSGCDYDLCFACVCDGAISAPPTPPGSLGRDPSQQKQLVASPQPPTYGGGQVSPSRQLGVGPQGGSCVVCGGKPKEATLVHGDTGHFATCLDCAYRLKSAGSNCPVCRQQFSLIIKTS